MYICYGNGDVVIRQVGRDFDFDVMPNILTTTTTTVQQLSLF